MRKLLLVAIALVAAGTIAFAISAFTGSSGSSTPAAAQVALDASGGEGTLAMDNCIVDVDRLYCYPEPMNKCRTKFTVKHLDKSTNCCGHDAGTLYFSVGGGAHTAMTADGSGYDSSIGCYYHNYYSAEYMLDNHFTVLYDVYDDADPTHCKNSGSFYIDCQ